MPDKLIPGEKKTPVYKKSGFKLKSGNSPLFKHVGSSPLAKVIDPVTSADVPKGSIHEIMLSGAESAQEVRKAKKGNVAASLTKKYGGTWTKTGGQWKNASGQTVSEHENARAQERVEALKTT